LIIMPLPSPAFDDPKHHLRIYQGDCLEILGEIPPSSVDLVFADPPYFLSNGGITCHAGKMVSVNKGSWDVSQGPDANHAFNKSWLAACQRALRGITVIRPGFFPNEVPLEFHTNWQSLCPRERGARINLYFPNANSARFCLRLAIHRQTIAAREK
jgi:hypothetical protein